MSDPIPNESKSSDKEETPRDDVKNANSDFRRGSSDDKKGNCFDIVSSVIIVIVSVGMIAIVAYSVFCPVSTLWKKLFTLILAFIVAGCALVEWKGDAIKEGIDLGSKYDKSANKEVSWIANWRRSALLAKAIKFLAVFAAVAVGVLT